MQIQILHIKLRKDIIDHRKWCMKLRKDNIGYRKEIMELCKMIMQLRICIMEEWKGNRVMFTFRRILVKGLSTFDKRV